MRTRKLLTPYWAEAVVVGIVISLQSFRRLNANDRDVVLALQLRTGQNICFDGWMAEGREGQGEQFQTRFRRATSNRTPPITT